MPEITIKYKSKKTLEALQDLSKYFDFVIFPAKAEKKKISDIHGISIVEGDPSIDISGVDDFFTGKGISAEELRRRAWERK